MKKEKNCKKKQKRNTKILSKERKQNGETKQEKKRIVKRNKK